MNNPTMTMVQDGIDFIRLSDIDEFNNAIAIKAVYELDEQEGEMRLIHSCVNDKKWRKKIGSNWLEKTVKGGKSPFYVTVKNHLKIKKLEEK